MSVEVRRVDDDEEWDEYVEAAPAATFFHRAEVLELQAEHAGATLYPLAGFKGEEPVGIFPLFSLRKGPVAGIFSPPPYLLVTYLGPVLLNQEKLSQRKAERRHLALIEGCLERVADEVDPWFTQVTTTVGYGDVRPFKWGGYEVIPQYTYHVDLDPDGEWPLDRFSADARRNVTADHDEEYVIEEGGVDAIERILEQVERRYREQGEQVSMPGPFVRAVGDGRFGGSVRAYTCRVAGEHASGIITVEHGDVVDRWVGGVKPDVETDLPINDLLDWEIMERAMARGVTRYDLVGAGNHRINRYKAKFDPELRTFYRVQSGSRVVDALVNTYRKLSGSKWLGL